MEQAGVVVVAGGAALERGDTDWLVRVYEATTGSLIWEDSFDVALGDDRAMAAEALLGFAYVAGFVTNAGGNLDVKVRAYELKTGRVLWEDQRDFGGAAEKITIQGIAIDSGRLFVCGESGIVRDTRGTEIEADWLVLAYDAFNGKLQWYDAPKSETFAHTIALSASDQRVYAAGLIEDSSHSGQFAVRCYSAENGELLWEDRYQHGNNSIAFTLSATSELVWAGGEVGDKLTIRPTIRVYDAASGTLAWRDVIEFGDGIGDVRAIALAGNRLVVVGSGGTKCSMESESDCDMLVRCYEPHSGRVRWARLIDVGGDDQAYDMAVEGEEVIICGVSVDSAGATGLAVLTLNLQTGESLWFDHLGKPGGFASETRPVLTPHVAVVAGTLYDSTGTAEWIVRAYSRR